MIQKIYVVLDENGTQSFEVEKLKRCISKLGETIESQGKLEMWAVSISLTTAGVAQVPIPIELDGDKKCLSIGSYCDEGLNAILEIQQCYGRSFFAFSEESSPLIVSIAEVREVEVLAKKLKIR